MQYSALGMLLFVFSTWTDAYAKSSMEIARSTEKGIHDIPKSSRCKKIKNALTRRDFWYHAPYNAASKRLESMQLNRRSGSYLRLLCRLLLSLNLYNLDPNQPESLKVPSPLTSIRNLSLCSCVSLICFSILFLHFISTFSTFLSRDGVLTSRFQ